MTKYTTFKAFEKNFSEQVWKIVVDESNRQIGVELREVDSTCAILYVFDFEGNELLQHKRLAEKEWTLEALQQQTLILKRVGDNLPIREGVLFLDLQGETRQLWQEYTWIDTYQGAVKVRHRSFQSGFEEYIDIATLAKTGRTDAEPDYSQSKLKIPIPYTGALPPSLQHLEIQDLPWVSRSGERLLWSYHTKEKEHYQLNLAITEASNLLWTQRLLSDMPKMIPQPFFQIDNQLFLLSYNKEKIVSYLV